jgi:hypothetical protein
MLERPLHLPDIKSTLPNINQAILRVFHTQTIPLPLVTIAFPSPGVLLKIETALSD